MSQPLIAYHSGKQMLVFFPPVAPQPIGFPVAAFRQMGFALSDEALNNPMMIPRLDAPQIHIGTQASVNHAVAMNRAARRAARH